MALNWDDLKVLLAVARSGSISRAAVLLRIDQSTTGRRLTGLEAELGATLFVRSKTGMAPTEAGEKLILYAQDVERRIDRIVEEAGAASAMPNGTVRLLGNAWVLDRLSSTVLAPFLAENPKLTLRLVTRPPDVRMRGDPTVSLWFEAPPQPGEFAIKLGDVPFALYCAADADPEDLGWVSFYDEDAPRRAPVKAWEKLRKPGDPLHLTATDADILHSAVRQRVGKGLLPMCLGSADPALKRIGEGAPVLVRVLHLHAHPDTVQSVRVQATIRWLRETFAEVFG